LWILHHFSQFPADAGANILQCFFFKPIKKGARGKAQSTSRLQKLTR
jgi:hypothetical protein